MVVQNTVNGTYTHTNIRVDVASEWWERGKYAILRVLLLIVEGGGHHTSGAQANDKTKTKTEKDRGALPRQGRDRDFWGQANPIQPNQSNPPPPRLFDRRLNSVVVFPEKKSSKSFTKTFHKKNP